MIPKELNTKRPTTSSHTKEWYTFPRIPLSESASFSTITTQRSQVIQMDIRQRNSSNGITGGLTFRDRS
jgi:hypothetical protein